MITSRKNNRGSTLIIIVVSIAVAAFLSAALAAAILSANFVSQNNLNAHQAYFTARSVVNAAITKLTKSSATPFLNYVNSLGDGTYYSDEGFFNGSHTNTYKLVITKSGDTLTLRGIGTYNRVSRTTTVMLKSKKDTVFDYSVFSGSELILSNGAKFQDGSIFTCTNLKLNGAFDGISKLLSINEVTVAPSSSTTLNEIHAGTNVNLLNANLTVNGEITAGSSISNSGASVDSDKINPPNNNFSFTDKDTVLSDYRPISLSDADSKSQMLVNSIAAISPSGEISSSGWLQGLPSSGTVTVNTSKGDVWLFIHDTNIAQWNNFDLEVTGKNRLYIFLLNNVNLTLKGTIKMKDPNAENKIFIFSNSSGSLTLESGSVIQACIYLDNRNTRLTINGNVNIVGSIEAQTVNATGNFNLTYKSPNLAGTPLESIAKNAHSLTHSSNTNWTVYNWSEK